MNNSKQFWIVLGVAASLLLAFFLYQYNWKKKLNWNVTFNEKGKEPYGVFVLKEILQKHFSNYSFTALDKKLEKSIPEMVKANSNYFFVGEALLLDTNDVNALTAFIKKGNTAFISSKTVPDILMDKVFDSPCDSMYWSDYFVQYDSVVAINFLHSGLRDTGFFDFKYIYKYEPYSRNWSYFDDYIYCDSLNYPVPIAKSADSFFNMVLLPYGEGALYLHTTPLALTNYYLTTKKGQQYAERIFAHLTKGDIYWDSFSRVPEMVGRNLNRTSEVASPLEPREGPLDYVLSQPPLAWAWYLLLTLGLLYLLFRAKRRQRMIPILGKNRNTSLEFIATIGRLHFSGQNHRQMAIKQMDLLLSFIRSEYRIPTKKLEEDFVQQLAQYSEIEETILQKLFLIYNNIKSSSFVSDKTLIELHKLIHYFYKNCR